MMFIFKQKYILYFNSIYEQNIIIVKFMIFSQNSSLTTKRSKWNVLLGFSTHISINGKIIRLSF